MKAVFLDGGYCRQLLGLIDRRSLRFVHFHAMFLALLHPEKGWIIIDTGYGNRFREATARFPYRFYRWVTPVQTNGTAAESLARAGIDARDVHHVIITHFHADHVGGLNDFPNATFHHRLDALAPLVALRPLAQVKAAFLPALLPADFSQRSRPISEKQFCPSHDLPFDEHDLWGDGSVRLVHLPGHAPGQLGVVFAASDNQPILYCADAYWRTVQLTGSRELTYPARKLQWSPADYAATLARLREVHAAGKYQLLPCHGEEAEQLSFQHPWPS